MIDNKIGVLSVYRDNGESNNVVLESVHKHNIIGHSGSVFIFGVLSPLVWGEVIKIAI